MTFPFLWSLPSLKLNFFEKIKVNSHRWTWTSYICAQLSRSDHQPSSKMEAHQTQRITNKEQRNKTAPIAGLLVFGGALAVTGVIAIASFVTSRSKAKAPPHEPQQSESDHPSLQHSPTNRDNAWYTQILSYHLSLLHACYLSFVLLYFIFAASPATKHHIRPRTKFFPVSHSPAKLPFWWYVSSLSSFFFLWNYIMSWFCGFRNYVE